MRKLTLVAIVSCLVVSSVNDARAEDTATQIAKGYYEEGQNLYIQEKYAEAAQKFLKAYEYKNHPAFLFNIAVCYEKHRDFANALANYDKYIKTAGDTPDAPVVKARIKLIRQHLSTPTTQSTTGRPLAGPKLAPIKTKGLVIITSNPEGAAIYLNDEKQGVFTRTPFTGSLEPGTYTFILSLKGYRKVRKTVTVRDDRVKELHFEMTEEQTLGWIEIRSNVPGAKIYMDKKDVGSIGQTPYSGYQRPGLRKVIVERPGYEPFVKTIKLIAGKTLLINAQLRQVSYGWLKITGRTTVGAVVKVNGKLIKCEGYPCRTKLPKGTHRIEMEREGFKPYLKEKVDIHQAEEVQLAIRLNPSPSRVKAWVSFGFAGALLAGGIVSGVISSNQSGSLEDDIAAGRVYDSGDPRFLKGKITALVADGLFAASAIVAGLGFYYLFRNVGPDSFGEIRRTNVSFTPVLSPEMAGVTGKVRF